MRKLRKVAPMVLVLLFVAAALILASRGETARNIWLTGRASGIGTDTIQVNAPSGYSINGFQIVPAKGAATVVAERWHLITDVSSDAGAHWCQYATYTDSFVSASHATYIDTVLTANLGPVASVRFRITSNDSCTITPWVSTIKAGD